MEVLLNLTPLDLLIMAEARMTHYRLHTLQLPAVLETATGMFSIWKNVSDRVLDMRSDRIFPAYNFSKNFKIIIGRDYWRNKYQVLPEDDLVWFTDGSRADSETGSCIFGRRPRGSFSFPLGKFATVFQTEIYAIFQCAVRI